MNMLNFGYIVQISKTIAILNYELLIKFKININYLFNITVVYSIEKCYIKLNNLVKK